MGKTPGVAVPLVPTLNLALILFLFFILILIFG